MKASAISSKFCLIESSNLAYHMAAIPDMVRPKRDSFCSLVKPIGLKISENKHKWTIRSPELSKRSMCGILN
ncbi:hypothetical protein CsSME_00023002 [Camellia sinensis var. sinensis]